MAVKGIGAVCYVLIVSAVLLLLMTLVASQGINILHLSTLNKIDFEVQIALSFLNCILMIGVAAAMLNGHIAGRHIWNVWAVVYLLLNLWQLDDIRILMPVAGALLILNFVLYSKPAQNYFHDHAEARGARISRRVDQSYNIFD